MTRDHTKRDAAPLTEIASLLLPDESNLDLAAAEAALKALADVFLQNRSLNQSPADPSESSKPLTDEMRYRTLAFLKANHSFGREQGTAAASPADKVVVG